MSMDSKDAKAAGNALVGWFNAQEITQEDALVVMSKVAAKVIVAGAAKPLTRETLHRAIDQFTLMLVNDVNAHTFNRRWNGE